MIPDGTASPETLERANARFYEAFESLDLTAMEQLWVHSEEVWCVHPGSGLIRGWTAVRQTWAAIFASTPYIQFIVTGARPLVYQDSGVVSCTENILSGHEPDGFGTAEAVATNVFIWNGRIWHMLAHHASPVLRSMG